MSKNVSPLFKVNQGKLSARSHGGEPPMPLEVRVAKLESDVEYIKRDITEIKTDIKNGQRIHDRDFRILFGAIISTTLGLAWLMAKGFHWL